MSEHRQRIALDFDGVLHSYTSPWAGTLIIEDEPTPGAITWLTAAVERFDVMIHTARLAWDPSEWFHENTPLIKRIAAMKAWLELHGCAPEVIARLQWHDGPGKPHAHIYIDDRAWRFNGTFPALDELGSFRPWNKQEEARDPIVCEVLRVVERGVLLGRAERALRALARTQDPHARFKLSDLLPAAEELAEEIREHFDGG